MSSALKPNIIILLVLASMAQLDVHPTVDQEVASSIFESCPTTFLDSDHEIFSMVSLSLMLIQDGQLSVFGERICTNTS